MPYVGLYKNDPKVPKFPVHGKLPQGRIVEENGTARLTWYQNHDEITAPVFHKEEFTGQMVLFRAQRRARAVGMKTVWYGENGASFTMVV
jgi:hypothetical protein